MAEDENRTIKARIDRIQHVTGNDGYIKSTAADLAQSVIYDTVGGSHPIMAALDDALHRRTGLKRRQPLSCVALYAEGALKSPRLTIAREIEGDILDIAQAQAEAAEKSNDAAHKQVHLGIAAFLAGASLEDALRRLCDARGIVYDAQRTAISKLQAALYQPSKQIEVISQSENKHITAWGTRETRPIMAGLMRSRKLKSSQ